MIRVFVVVVLILVLVAPASSADIVVTVAAQPGAPATLTYCSMQKQFVPITRGVSVEGFRTSVFFKNATTKPIVEVGFLFTMRDTMGTVIDSHTQTSKGNYAPGVEIDNIRWLTVDSWPTLGGMDCAIERVVFVDGSSWSIP